MKTVSLLSSSRLEYRLANNVGESETSAGQPKVPSNVTSNICTLHCLSYKPRKFKVGIGSLFDPVLTLWGGGHIGSSRMEQSYCTSGFF